MNKVYVFIARIILGGMFAVLISRFFVPNANFYQIAGFGVALVGIAYFFEYIRVKRLSKK